MDFFRINQTVINPAAIARFRFRTENYEAVGGRPAFTSNYVEVFYVDGSMDKFGGVAAWEALLDMANPTVLIAHEATPPTT